MDFNTTPPVTIYDVEREARRLRAEAFAALFASARARIVSFFAARATGAHRHA